MEEERAGLKRIICLLKQQLQVIIHKYQIKKFIIIIIMRYIYSKKRRKINVRKIKILSQIYGSKMPFKYR